MLESTQFQIPLVDAGMIKVINKIVSTGISVLVQKYSCFHNNRENLCDVGIILLNRV